MKEFKNAVELLTLCTEKNLPISEIMRQREIILGETTAEDVDARMARVLEIMKDAAFSPVKKPVKSMGGLIGGEAKKLSLHQTSVPLNKLMKEKPAIFNDNQFFIL